MVMTPVPWVDCHVGLKLPNWGDSASPATIADVAVAADRAGFDSLWVSDHIVTSTADHAGGLTTRTPFYEVVSTLSFVAALTSRAQLATGVLIAPLRDPLLLAKQAATVDRLSSGRMVLGLGSGWLETEFDALGKSWRGRGRAMAPGIEAMRAAWRSDDFTTDGGTERVGMHPRPVRDAVPVLLGGRSQAALTRAATIADGWYGANMTASEVAEVSKFVARLRAPEESRRFHIGVKPPRMSPGDSVSVIAAYSDSGADFVVLDPVLDGLDARDMADAVTAMATDLRLNDRPPRPLAAQRL